jgi:hypothetical protein
MKSRLNSAAAASSGEVGTPQGRLSQLPHPIVGAHQPEERKLSLLNCYFWTCKPRVLVQVRSS